MDIYELIRHDHEEAKELMQQIEAMDGGDHKQRLALCGKLKDAVIAHNDAEAESFYAALEKHREARSDVKRSRKEHDEANALIATVADKALPPEEWEEKFQEFRKAILHHIEQEESEVFDEAHDVFSAVEARRLAEVMQGLKEKKKAVLRKAG